MSEFDKQNEDVFQIVKNNPRRRDVIQPAGYIISQEQAERFAVYEALQQRRPQRRTITAVLALIAVIGMIMGTLIR